MATTNYFAYNPGSPIAGTEQVGDIAIGVTPQNYPGGYGGVRWWNGPDEDLGFVICYSVPTEDHPSPDGPIAGVGFFRSKLPTESSFIEIAEYVSSGQTFTTGLEARTWLDNNGYWTSYPPYPQDLLVYLDSSNRMSYNGVGNTWRDLTINNNDATLFNSPTYSSDFDGIIQFNDSNLQYGTIPDIGSLSAWTIEVWVRLSEPLTGKNTAVITNEFDSVNFNINFTIGTIDAPSTTKLQVGFFDNAGWKSTVGLTPTTNTWYQVVGTWDGTTIREYTNGVQTSTFTSPGSVSLSGGEIRLMRKWDSTLTQSNLVDGDLAIVKIYNDALNGADILANYNENSSRFFNVTPTPTASLPLTPTVTPTNTPTPTIGVTPTPTPSSSGPLIGAIVTNNTSTLYGIFIDMQSPSGFETLSPQDSNQGVDPSATKNFLILNPPITSPGEMFVTYQANSAVSGNKITVTDSNGVITCVDMPTSTDPQSFSILGLTLDPLNPPTVVLSTGSC